MLPHRRETKRLSIQTPRVCFQKRPISHPQRSAGGTLQRQTQSLDLLMGNMSTGVETSVQTWWDILEVNSSNIGAKVH